MQNILKQQNKNSKNFFIILFKINLGCNLINLKFFNYMPTMPQNTLEVNAKIATGTVEAHCF